MFSGRLLGMYNVFSTAAQFVHRWYGVSPVWLQKKHRIDIDADPYSPKQLGVPPDVGQGGRETLMQHTARHALEQHVPAVAVLYPGHRRLGRA